MGGKEKKENTDLKSFIENNLSNIFKAIWFIGVFIFVSNFVKNNLAECLNFEIFSGYNVFFIVLIIFLVYPLFNSIKIYGFELVKENWKEGIPNVTEEYKADIPKLFSKIIKENKPKLVRNQGERFITDMANKETTIYENADTLKNNLKKKYEDIVGNKKANLDNSDKILIYGVLYQVYDKGIGELYDDLLEDKFFEWIEDSKNTIKAVSEKTNINLYENFNSLTGCLIGKKLPCYLTLYSCIDYLLDIMKLVAGTKWYVI